jgi:hypothetical protein
MTLRCSRRWVVEVEKACKYASRYSALSGHIRLALAFLCHDVIMMFIMRLRENAFYGSLGRLSTTPSFCPRAAFQFVSHTFVCFLSPFPLVHCVFFTVFSTLALPSSPARSRSSVYTFMKWRKINNSTFNTKIAP